MLRKAFLLGILVSVTMASDYTNKSHPRPHRVRYYPKNSVFKKADLMDNGCVVFIKHCPRDYKYNSVCGRHYDGYYKTFNNFCELEYENCNGWRQWSLIKRDRC